MKHKLIPLLLIFLLTGCSLFTQDTPKLFLNPGIDTVEVNTEFIDAGAKARVGVQDIEIKVIESNVNINKLGSYKIIYEATYNNKTYAITRIVDVIDETPPTVTLKPGIDTVKIDYEWIDAGIEASDNSLEEITIEVKGFVDSKTVGEYEIIYIATDSSNNKTSISRFVSVVN